MNLPTIDPLNKINSLTKLNPIITYFIKNTLGFSALYEQSDNLIRLSTIHPSKNKYGFRRYDRNFIADSLKRRQYKCLQINDLPINKYLLRFPINKLILHKRLATLPLAPTIAINATLRHPISWVLALTRILSIPHTRRYESLIFNPINVVGWSSYLTVD
jgi:hypothetical protein